MKICSKCKQIKELIEFYIDKRSTDNLASCCKKCQLKASDKWKKNNPGKVNESARNCYGNS